MGGATATLLVAGRRVAVRTVPARAEPYVFFPSVGEYPVYDDAVYDSFAVEDGRRRAYRAAIEAAAPGRIVVDIGTGRDALWAVEAARTGARHVYAVEAHPAVAARARHAVARAGLADRVTVVAGHSEDVTLPVPAEVCVSEIVGNIASAEGAAAVLADAQRRLCAPDCVWIPQRCQTRVAAVDLRGPFAHGRVAVAAESLDYLDRIFACVGHPFDVRLCLAGRVEDIVVSSAAAVESLAFGAADQPLTLDATTTVDLAVHPSGGHLTGLLLWPTVCCAAGQPGLDGLDRATRGWAPVYAPISSRGIEVRRGERIRVAFTRSTSDDGVHPDYRLVTRLLTARGTRHLATWHAPHHGFEFRASDLYRHVFPGRALTACSG